MESFSVRILSVITTQGANLKKSSLFSSFSMSLDGRLILLKELDRETCSGIRLEVCASSKGKDTKDEDTKVVILLFQGLLILLLSFI